MKERAEAIAASEGTTDQAGAAKNTGQSFVGEMKERAEAIAASEGKFTDQVAAPLLCGSAVWAR